MFHKTTIVRLALIVAVALASCAPPSPVFDGTNVWTSHGPGGGSIFTLAIDPASPTTLYAGTLHTGVLKSTNGSGNWSPASTGLSDLAVSDLIINPVRSSVLYVATGAGVFKSTNAGGSWNLFSSGLPISNSVLALAIDPLTPAKLYAATYGAGVFAIEQVLTLSPDIGLTGGGTTLTIQGLDFTPTAGVTVTVGGVVAGNVTIINSTTITATTGAHAPGVVDVVVTNPDNKSATLLHGFVYADMIYQVYLPVTGR